MLFSVKTGRGYPHFSDLPLWLDNIYPLDCKFFIIPAHCHSGGHLKPTEKNAFSEVMKQGNS